MSLKYNLFSPWYNRYIAEFVLSNNDPLILLRSCRGRGHMVAGFTITYAMSGYHHKSCEFETCWWWGVLDTTLCDKVCQWHAWFSADTTVSSFNTTNCYDKKNEMSLKGHWTSHTLTLNLTCKPSHVMIRVDWKKASFACTSCRMLYKYWYLIDQNYL
jgi:hypothetical protein